MSEVQRINITLPRKLVSNSRVLIDEGLYSSFSELVRESLKNEILLDKSLLEKNKRLKNFWLAIDSFLGLLPLVKHLFAYRIFVLAKKKASE